MKTEQVYKIALAELHVYEAKDIRLKQWIRELSYIPNTFTDTYSEEQYQQEMKVRIEDIKRWMKKKFKSIRNHKTDKSKFMLMDYEGNRFIGKFITYHDNDIIKT